MTARGWGFEVMGPRYWFGQYLRYVGFCWPVPALRRGANSCTAANASSQAQTPAISPNGRYGMFGLGRANHSGLMLANFTTLAHFSMSSAMNLPNSTDELANAV